MLMKMYRHVKKFDEVDDSKIISRIGVGRYQHIPKLYLTHIEPTTHYELLDITDDFKNKRPSEDIIKTLQNYLSNIDLKRDHWYQDLLYNKEIKQQEASVKISDNCIVLFSNEQDVKDDIFGSDMTGYTSKDDELFNNYSVTYQYFTNLDKQLYIYSSDNIPIPIIKKCLYNPPKGLNGYVCISKVYRITPHLHNDDSIKEFINHIIFNHRNIGDLASDENMALLRDIYNNIKQLGWLNGYNKLTPITLRLLTYISEQELKECFYKMYLKTHNVYITDDITLSYTKHHEETLDKHISDTHEYNSYTYGIRVITDTNDMNSYYYNINGKTIELSKCINNNIRAHIVIKENNNTIKLDIKNDNLSEHHIYTNKYDAMSAINKDKLKENEIKLKEKEMDVKDKELDFKHTKIGLDNHMYNKKVDVELEELKYKTIGMKKPIRVLDDWLKTIGTMVSIVGGIISIVTASMKLLGYGTNKQKAI